MSERNQYGTEPGRLFNFTASDSTDLPNDTRGLIVGVAGAVKLTDDTGTTDVFTLPVGVFPIRVRRIWANGTTATGLVGIY
jgi:hypothetical protein